MPTVFTSRAAQDGPGAVRFKLISAGRALFAADAHRDTPRRIHCQQPLADLIRPQSTTAATTAADPPSRKATAWQAQPPLQRASSEATFSPQPTATLRNLCRSSTRSD